MDKSPEAFRTISEVADFLDTPAHVLRFWESRFPQIRPVKRAGGRRYYRPGDVALLAGIKKLLHDEGMTIRGVQKILREQGIRHVAGLASEDAGPLLDDADIEAVLSAEYGPRDRLGEDDRPSSEALQSAQIISLETALNRQDTARDTTPMQPELWPPAPPESPATDAQAWPGDPGDALLAPEVTDPTAQVGADSAEPVSATAEAPLDADQDSEPPFAEALLDSADLPDADPSEANAGVSEPVSEEASNSRQDAASDSSSTSASDEADGGETVETATTAAMLRRTSAADVSAVQPQLIHLRDRLIDLRGRVAEAARRKAK